MFDYETFCSKKIQELKCEERYRVFQTLERYEPASPYANWHKDSAQSNSKKRVSVWCSNDYLGMTHHPFVVAAFKKSAEHFGVGSGGTRNIGGTAFLHVSLENELKSLHKKEGALLFTSGYVANQATLETLGKHIPGVVFFSDEKNHASLISGIRISQATKHIFRHNDMTDLKTLLASYPKSMPKIIVATSIYSMKGDVAPLHDLVTLSKEYGALLYIDEVHAVGIYGEEGEGMVGRFDLSKDVDIIQGNFAKAYGVLGGYIATSSLMTDFIRSYGNGFIFTTSLPPAIAGAALASIQYLRRDRALAFELLEKASFLKACLKKTSLFYHETNTHIVSIAIGDNERCNRMSRILIENYSMYIQPINYPTVPKGEAGFRVTVSPYHTESLIDEFVNALESVWLATKDRDDALKLCL